MSRILSIGAAQLWTIQSSGDRASVVQPMLDLMRQARQRVILRDWRASFTVTFGDYNAFRFGPARRSGD